MRLLRFLGLPAMVVFLMAVPSRAQVAVATIDASPDPVALAVDSARNKIYVGGDSYPLGPVGIIDGATNTISYDVTDLFNSGPIVVNPDSGNLYYGNTNTGSQTVTDYDPSSDTSTTIAAGTIPYSMAVNPATDTVYVVNSNLNGAGTLTVIDGATSATSTVPTGDSPVRVVVNPETNKVYVANTGGNSVTVVDGATNATTMVAVGTQPDWMAVNPATNKIYVPDQTSADVVVIDGATNSTTVIAPGYYASAVAVNAVTNRIYTADYGQNVVSAIDGGTNAVTQVSVGTLPVDVAVDMVTDRIYVANSASNNVTMIDGPTNSTTTLTDPNADEPSKIAINPATHLVYVVNHNSQNVSVFDGRVHFVVTAPASVKLGTPATVGVAAVDAYGSPVPGYTGVVQLGSSDPKATLPAAAPLGQGTGSFPVTFGTLGSQTVTASDTALPSMAGVSAPVTVVASAPAISAQPATQSAASGSAVTFSVTVNAGPDPAYQWYLDGMAIPGATGPSCSISGAQVSDTGAYSVAVTNAGGTVTSQPAFLTVSAPSGNPTIPVQPQSFTVYPGETVVLTTGSSAQGAGSAVLSVRDSAPPATYQWFFNGTLLADGPGIGGSQSATLALTAGATRPGSYACIVANSVGSVVSVPAVLTLSRASSPGRLVNVSCRAQVGTGDDILIVGFVVGGAGSSGPEPVLARASGPALSGFGVTGVLPDPELTLSAPAGVVASNDGWAGNPGVASSAAQAGAFAWGMPTSKDSALVETLPGGPYTGQVYGSSGDTGVALAEVYDLTPAGAATASSPRLINLSARLQVGTGGDILIAGFVIGGATAKTVLIRASGPALLPFGLTGVLADPELQLVRDNPDGSSTPLQADTGWGGSAQIAATAGSVGAFSWGPSATPDSAILVTLPPGAYTAQVSGASSDKGLALVEVYDVP